MKEEKELSFVFTHSKPVAASTEQESYLIAGNYTIPGSEGKVFKRIRECLAFNPLSGNILVREKTCCDNYNYEKVVVVSRNGMPEKYKGTNF